MSVEVGMDLYTLEQQVAALLAGSKASINEREEFSERFKKGLTARETMERKGELSDDQSLSNLSEV